MRMSSVALAPTIMLRSVYTWRSPVASTSAIVRRENHLTGTSCALSVNPSSHSRLAGVTWSAALSAMLVMSPSALCRIWYGHSKTCVLNVPPSSRTWKRSEVETATWKSEPWNRKSQIDYGRKGVKMKLVVLSTMRKSIESVTRLRSLDSYGKPEVGSRETRFATFHVSTNSSDDEKSGRSTRNRRRRYRHFRFGSVRKRGSTDGRRRNGK